MFFSRKKQIKEKHQADQQQLKEFKTCVTTLMDGIHKLDEQIQKMIQRSDVSHDSALFVVRSSEDIFALIAAYKHTKYFHRHMDIPIDASIKTLKKMMMTIEDKCRRLLMIKENRDMTKEQLNEIVGHGIIDDDAMTDTSRELFKMGMIISELIFEVKTDYREYRCALTMLRGVISIDYIAIISGIDIPLLYEDYETLVNNQMKQEILYDIKGMQRELASIKKEENHNE